MYLALAALVGCVAVHSVAAQQATDSALAGISNAERVATDRDTRSHDYDLVHQRIEVRDFDWDSTSFTGRVATTLIVRRPGLDSVILDAGAGLAVSRVAGPRGSALATGRHGDTLVVRLARAAAFGDTVRFTIEYHAHIENGRGLTFIQSDGRPHRPREIWSQGEAQDNHDWFPTYDFPNDKMTWEVIATVPAGYTAVSNGRLISDVRGAGSHTTHWSQDRPSATYLVSLVVAPLARIADHWHAVPVDYYVYHEDSALARRLFGVTPDMIDVYSRLTRTPYPWAKYAQTTVADFFGGMENVSATTLIDGVPDTAAYHDRPWFQYILIPHELAHQWFGDDATTENWSNLWLNEGFAEFMPGQYWGTKLGAHAEQDYYLDEYRQFLAIERRQSMPVAAPESNNIYPKGALVLEMLEQYLGPQRFWTAVHRYLAQHAFGTAVTEDLRAAVLDATGENLAWFWNEWLYDAGLPKFTVSATYDSAGQRLTLAVRQTQGDSLRAESAGSGGFVTPRVFRMPVAVRVGTAAGDVLAHTQLSSREQTIVVDSVRSAPTMVVFDDGNAVLKQLTFDQPTLWLATELTRDPNLWDRAWATAELAKRTSDSAAAAALAVAVRGADYFLTRAEATTALGGFPARWVASAVDAALRDTSAAVRETAVTALAAVDSAQAADRLRTRLRADPSYAVRAAALRALARVDSAGRSALIAQGLATPSYGDVIRDAALEAAVDAGDSTLLPTIDRLSHESRGAVLALAGFAARGNAHALDLLTRALDDDRAAVRQWAVVAFARALPPKIALPALQAHVGSLTHSDAREFVTRVIGRLEKSADHAGAP
jgi:aminopeptidase N